MWISQSCHLQKAISIQGDGQIVVVQAADLLQTTKIIPDLATRAQCFAIYVAVRGAHQPNKLADLMGYQSLVARASKKFKWPSWVIYDQNFRQEAAGNDELQWAKAEPRLYTQCFTDQDISRENWCAKFNRYQGDCRFGKECKFIHACSSCRGPHLVSRCRAGNANQQKQGK